ncbi:MAG: ComEC/Rec2 family competence protein [Chlamydiae bacterium]|nr:ComEC/Rec2 family competence protein [Chlamydiota bacterium]
MLIILLFINFLNYKKILWGLFTALLGFFFTFYYYPNIKEEFTECTGRGTFEIASIRHSSAFNQNCFIYRGILKNFRSEDKIYKNLPCSIFFKTKKDEAPRPNGNFSYKVQGKLINKGNFNFVLKTKQPWHQKKRLLSFAEERYSAKEFVKNYLKEIIPDKNVYYFINASTTADVDDQFLYFSFAKTGLQHVLAISGFNFAVLVMFFSFFFKRFLPLKASIYILLMIINLYFLFVGSCPSVQRAWVMIQVALIAQLFTKRYSSVNALGISLLIVCISDPLNLINVGFQLSFLSVGAIFLVYPPIDKWLSRFFKKREDKEIKELSLIAYIGYKISSYLSQAISLNIAINLTILPIVLFHFYKLPFLGFVYNLFIPLFSTLSLILVMISSTLYLIWAPLAYPINLINNLFTAYFLKLITYPPPFLGFYIRVKGLSLELALSLIIIVSLLFVFFKTDSDQEIFRP